MMSTHIEGGFRLTPGTDPFSLIRQAKLVLEPIRDKLVGHEIAYLARHIVHDADLTGSKPDVRPLAAAAQELAAETAKGDWRGLAAKIGLATDPETGRIHLLVIGDTEYRNAVEGLEGVEDYSYWNHTDRLDEVSEAEWEERRNAWDRVLPGIGSVSHNMAVWTLEVQPRSAAWPDAFESIKSHLPSGEDRAVRLVRDRICKILGDRHPIDLSRMSQMMHRIEAASTMAKTDGFAHIRALVANLIAPSDWDTFGEGSSVSLLHSNLDRVDWMVTCAMASSGRSANETGQIHLRVLGHPDYRNPRR